MTDIRRLILASLLMMVGIMLWNSWMAEHPPKLLPTTQVTVPVTATTATSANVPGITTPTPSLNVANRYIQIKTDAVEATIDRAGGAIVSLKLLKYPTVINQPNNPFVLFTQDPDSYYIATSGLTGDSLPAPNQMIFESSQQSYTLQNGEQNLNVKLTWKNSHGLTVTKTYVFPANDYLIQASEQIDNQSNSSWQGQFYTELQRKPVNAGGMGPFHFNTYLGGVISSPEKRYEKVTFKDMDNQNIDQSAQGGWFAMVQHYFLSAWVPPTNQNYHYYSNVNSDSGIYTLGMQSAALQVAAHQQISTSAKLYAGPEISDRLAQIAPGLNLTVDYGVLWFIAVIIFGLMKKLYAFTGNWGWSIVLVTLIIKIIFYKLNSISFRSMAKMRALQPKLQQVRERCGDDKQKLAQATMELYKREKINPLGGCLPMIVQIPVFLALYWVLAESVELRQAPFILWIHDLSVKDPYYILPLLMGLTIFIQQTLAPKSPDPVQQRIMMLLPIIFTALFLSFPSGLVLYWVVNNTLSILQQWYITKHVVPKDAAKAVKSSGWERTKKTPKS